MKRLGDLPYLAHQSNKNSKSGVFIRSNPGEEDVSVASLLLSFKMCSESREPRCESQIQLVILEDHLVMLSLSFLSINLTVMSTPHNSGEDVIRT